MSLSTLILKQNYLVVEYVIDKIAEVENYNESKKDELKETILGELKAYKKRKKRVKKKNGYHMFLADKDVDNQIREEHKDIKFGSISKIKGKMWNELPEDEKNKYKELAMNFNNQD